MTRRFFALGKDFVESEVSPRIIDGKSHREGASLYLTITKALHSVNWHEEESSARMSFIVGSHKQTAEGLQRYINAWESR